MLSSGHFCGVFLGLVTLSVLSHVGRSAEPGRAGAGKQPSAPAEPPVAVDPTSREPASVEAAARVLDLRTFPMMGGAQVHDWRQLGQLMYQAKGDAKTAFAFQRQHLTQRGWKELPGAHVEGAYASGNFTKEGFVVAVSVSEISGDPNKSGWVDVTLRNLGNVPTGKLPIPAGAKPFYPNVLEASYITDAKVPDTVAACRKLLLAAGWEPYGNAGYDESSQFLYFKRNAIKLDAWVSTAPAQGGKTLIRYSTELLSADLPVPADAPDPRYDDAQKTLRFDWPGENADAVVAFYQQRLPKQAWKPTTEQPVRNDKEEFLIFRSPQGDMISLDLARFSGVVRVKVQHRTAVEVAEMDRRIAEEAERRRQALAKKNQKIKVAVPIPAQAENVEHDSENVIEFTLGTGHGPAAFDAFRKHFQRSGWTEEEGTQTERNFGSLRFTKGEASVSCSYIDSGLTDAEVTVSGSGVVLEPMAAKDKPRPGDAPRTARRDPPTSRFPEIPGMPKLPGGEELPDVPDVNALLKALGAADEKPHAASKTPQAAVGAAAPKAAPGERASGPRITVADQKQSRGTLWIGDKTYKLEYGVAYETKSFDEPVTEILLCEKPIAVDKLVAALRTGGDADDAVGFQPYLKLRFDPSGALTYLFIWADNTSINLGSPGADVVQAELTVKDGRARGKAAMEKPKELFQKQYRFEAAFDAKLATGKAAESDAAPTEPAPDELVAEEHDGLPFPQNQTNRSSTSSRYRKSVTVVVPAETQAVVDFYRRELTARGWKEIADSADVTPDLGQLGFTGPEGDLAVRLERHENAVTVKLAARYPEKAKAAGLLPQPNRGRLVLGNASQQEVAIVINGRTYKVAAGRGAKEPKDGTSLHILPGKYSVTIKVPGQADATEVLKVNVDETWGVIVLPTGGHYADQLY